MKILSETEVQSSYAASNKGIREAKGDLIVFTDADCIVTPDWLKNLVTFWSDETIGCFAGEIEAYKPSSLVEVFSDRQGILRQSGTLNSPYLPYPQTANAAYRKSVFDQVGLFVPEMTSGGDADIAWRMQKQLGLKIQFIPEALVYHKHRADLQGLYNQYNKYEYGKFFWTKSYPDYPFPTIEERRQQLEGNIEALHYSLKDSVPLLAKDKIDFVEFVAPFLRMLMSAATFKARVDIAKNHQEMPEETIATAISPAAPPARKPETEYDYRSIIETQEETIRQQMQRIADLESSLSWKVTAPLRRLCDLLLTPAQKR